jgi:hypothetical protein
MSEPLKLSRPVPDIICFAILRRNNAEDGYDLYNDEEYLTIDHIKTLAESQGYTLVKNPAAKKKRGK